MFVCINAMFVHGCKGAGVPHTHLSVWSEDCIAPVTLLINTCYCL